MPKVGSIKFVRASDQDPKLKSYGGIDTRDKFIVFFQPSSLRKMNSSPKASSFLDSGDSLPSIPIAIPTCQHYGKLRHVRPRCAKLTSHPYMKVNMNASSSPPQRTTPWS